jgi:hypothetical protein
MMSDEIDTTGRSVKSIGPAMSSERVELTPLYIHLYIRLYYYTEQSTVFSPSSLVDKRQHFTTYDIESKKTHSYLS